MSSADPLYAELAKAEEYVRSLRREINSRTLVARLPIEVLALIFTCFPASNDDRPRRFAPPPTWLAVTQVCQRWRHTALSFPYLWTNIILWNPYWTREMIMRSKTAPISLELSYGECDPRPPDESTLLALHHVYRARTIAFSSVATARFFPFLTQQPAPYLEILTLSQPSYINYSRILESSEVKLFQGKTPKLRSLKLSGGHLSWPTSLFQHNLTSLALEATALDPQPTSTDVLQALACTPQLQSLVLTHTVPHFNTALPFNPTPLHNLNLPCLRSISITTKLAIGDVYALISSITYPADASIKITCEKLSVPPKVPPLTIIASSRPLLYSLSERHDMPDDGLDTPKGLRVYQLGMGWAMFIGIQPAGSPSSPAMDPLQLRTAEWEPSIHLCLRWDVSKLSRNQSEALFTMACQLLPVRDITMIDIDSDTFALPTNWWAAFSGLERVTKLSVRGKAVAGFAVALVRQVPVGAREESSNSAYRAEEEDIPALGREPRQLFPELSQLGIGKVVMCPALLETLKEGLRMRTGPTRLSKLAIRDCDVTHEGVAGLAKCMGAEVDWDCLCYGYTKLLESAKFLPR